jgi:hypothetical protein
MRRRLTIPLLGAALLAANRAARADVLLTPGQANLMPGTAYPVAGSSLLASKDLKFDNGRIAGTVREEVFREAGGTLDFLYEVQNKRASQFAVAGLALANFGGFDPNVNFATNTNSIPGFVPATAGSFAAAQVPAGQLLAFGFGGPGGTAGLNPGVTSQVVFVRTNATAFDDSGIMMVQGKNSNGDRAGSSGLAGAFRPVPASAPEPTSLALLAASLPLAGGLGFRHLRRRQARPSV